MTPATSGLDRTAAPPPGRRRWWRVANAAIGILFVPLIVPQVGVRQEEQRIDPVTGSVTWRTVWLGFMDSGPRLTQSPLEERLRESGIEWNRSWRFMSNTSYNVLGGATGHACGRAPPIYSLRPVQAGFAAAASDAELRELVRVMQSGDESAQEAAVRAAVDKSLAWGVAAREEEQPR